MTVYFSFAYAHGMIAGRDTSRLVVTKLTAEQAGQMVEAAKVAENLVPALNPSHTATVEAMSSRFGISMPIPERAPMVSLQEGDQLIVMSVRGLPRREGDKVHYSEEEIAGATFEFALYELIPTNPVEVYFLVQCTDDIRDMEKLAKALNIHIERVADKFTLYPGKTWNGGELIK